MDKFSNLERTIELDGNHQKIVAERLVLATFLSSQHKMTYTKAFNLRTKPIKFFAKAIDEPDDLSQDQQGQQSGQRRV